MWNIYFFETHVVPKNAKVKQIHCYFSMVVELNMSNIEKQITENINIITSVNGNQYIYKMDEFIEWFLSLSKRHFSRVRKKKDDFGNYGGGKG